MLARFVSRGASADLRAAGRTRGTVSPSHNGEPRAVESRSYDVASTPSQYQSSADDALSDQPVGQPDSLAPLLDDG